MEITVVYCTCTCILHAILRLATIMILCSQSENFMQNYQNSHRSVIQASGSGSDVLLVFDTVRYGSWQVKVQCSGMCTFKYF